MMSFTSAKDDDIVPMSAAVISPDGRHVLVGTVKGLRLFDVATGKPAGERWSPDSSGSTHGR